jgi:NAD(P)-dependent dehydrogenase (short-subunit alcohol dehydrogenase family)
MAKLERKIALVTGASSGIGQAVAERLAKAGYTVYGTSRRETSVGSRSFHMLPLDVTSDASVEAAVGEVMRLEGRIDSTASSADSTGCRADRCRDPPTHSQFYQESHAQQRQ